MSREHINNAVQICHSLLASCIHGDEDIVDATAGNGHDMLYAAGLTSGRIYGFDIQEKAVSATRELLQRHGLLSDRVRLVCESHTEMDKHVVSPVKAVLFNLGYLPGGDKTITTAASTTLSGLGCALRLLSPGGMVFIVVYRGHPHGEKEYEALRDFCAALPQKQYNVAFCSFPNQAGKPPLLFVIEFRNNGAAAPDLG
ncbi:MAG: class I SAM-dependent methyltransferase [Spirochaetales bacterium]|nr:class I SAM-dependent methyltransferase [Spirochaetales bacterium]